MGNYPTPEGYDVAPVYGENIFAPDALKHPFSHYKKIRDLGPVVRLPTDPEIFALSRFHDIKEALNHRDILTSSKGVGFNDYVNREFPEPPTIQRDDESHKRLRRAVQHNLTPVALKRYRTMLKEIIDTRISEAANGETIDAVTSVSQLLPLKAIKHLVGLPENGRERMLEWATATFNSGGPIEAYEDREAFVRDAEILIEAMMYVRQVKREDLVAGSWTSDLFDAVAAGKLTMGEAHAAMSGLVIPSLDTTIFAMSSLLYALGQNPDQYEMLKRDPGLISGAVYEAVRHSGPARWFSRYALSDYVAGDVFIPAGARVMLMYAAANRDERRYDDPDRFDITRKAGDQLGWGGGPHLCGGMNLARLEMELLLESLIAHVDRIEVEEPELSESRGLYGLTQLPLRLFRRS
ncbi:cytochrome P450 [Sphingobium lactosutens]|uniref:Cytochrome P450 n=1 Tax=Sphingobium lactosutens DS20 TaxID=1331060 RepID=T0IQ80_9SPHN|nr:cytochrome P450 [Sphingobium lactosutens]EQB11794.1 hypothetical protein RLDS_21945 [Sphingobium lactosutens DS20]